MIDKLTKTCIDKIICEINKPLNKEKINNIINPLYKNVLNKLLPYILFLFILLIFNLILIIIILIIIIYKNNIVNI